MTKRRILKGALWFVLPLFFILCGAGHSEANQWVRVKDFGERDAGQFEVIEFSADTSESKTPDVPQAPGWPQSIWGSSSYAPSKGVALADLDKDGNLEIIAASTN